MEQSNTFKRLRMINLDEINDIRALFPLYGQTIQLATFEESDISETYVSWLNNPDIVKYSNQRFKQHSIKSCLDYFQSFHNSSAFFLAIKNKNDNALIGTMTAYINIHHRTADIGILIGNQSYQGKGIAKEAWILLLTLLLNETNVRKVTGGTLSCNQAMVAIMKKAGMQPDGIRIKQELIDDTPHDIVHFASFSKKH